MRRPFYIVVLALLAVIALTQVVVAQEASSVTVESVAGCTATLKVTVAEGDATAYFRAWENDTTMLADVPYTTAVVGATQTVQMQDGQYYRAELLSEGAGWIVVANSGYFGCETGSGTGGTDGSGTGGTDGSGTGGTDGSGTGGTDGSGTGGTDGSGTGSTDGSGTGGTDGSGTGGTDGSGTGGTDGSGTGGTDGSGTGGLPADDDVVVQPRLIPGPPFNPGDDRLNRQAWAPVAVYCEDSSSQVRVYAINPDNGRGSLVLNVDYSDFDQAASGANALIASQGGIQLYLTMDGDWVVVAPQADGKQYQFAFDGCA